MKTLLLLLLLIPFVTLRLHTDDLFELEELLKPEHKYRIPSSFYDRLLGETDDDDDDEDDRPLMRKTYEDTDDELLPPIPSTSTDRTTPTTRTQIKCLDQYETKTEQIVRVKFLKENARLMRVISIEQPSAASQFSLKEICVMKCCNELNCDLAMLSEQKTHDGYKCYLFACNGTCPLAFHQDYSVIIPKKNGGQYFESRETVSNATNANQNPSRSRKPLIRRISVLSVILALSLISTFIFVLVLIFYCRRQPKRGRRLKNYSVDADYLINGLYL